MPYPQCTSNWLNICSYENLELNFARELVVFVLLSINGPEGCGSGSPRLFILTEQFRVPNHAALHRLQNNALVASLESKQQKTIKLFRHWQC